jgi:hypothetical protein
MKPVTQTITLNDGSDLPGNCLQAAVASLLDLDLDDVPHFVLHEDWLERLAAFADDGGYRIHYRSLTEPPPAFGLAFGHTSRSSEWHAVVVMNGEVVWDPHPSRDGLVSVRTYVDWEAIDAAPAP